MNHVDIVNNIDIEKQFIKKQLIENQTNLLSVTIEYPKLIATPVTSAITTINDYYQQVAENLLKYAEEVLLPSQRDAALSAQLGQYPFRPGELFFTYDIGYQNECLLSFFFDQYEFLGGAHGSTYRFSQTWNTNTGKQIKLEESFISPKYYKEEVIEMIRAQLTDELNRGIEKYYKECLIDVEHTFKEDNYYLSPKGLVIYFQQYEIAPYASGIPEFTLPFNSMIRLPKCDTKKK